MTYTNSSVPSWAKDGNEGRKHVLEEILQAALLTELEPRGEAEMGDREKDPVPWRDGGVSSPRHLSEFRCCAAPRVVLHLLPTHSQPFSWS